MAVLVALGGCGQKGPLRLSKPSAEVPFEALSPAELPASGPVGSVERP